MRRRLLATAAIVTALLGQSGPAGAHPLGNFTINHLTELQVVPARIRIRYVLDMAEIPSYSALRAQSASGKPGPRELSAWGQRQAADLRPSLLVSLDGKPLRLTIDRTQTRTRPGAGGLATLYLIVDEHATLPTGEHTLRVEDKTFPGRLGWKDIVIAPATEPTRELTNYPSALTGSPRNTTVLSATITAAGSVSAVRNETQTEDFAAAPAAPVTRSNTLSDLLAHGTRDPWFILFTLLVAIALGALHALEPGHGKTLLAVSLVGARATAGQAALLAGSLTIAHTVGVLALGAAIITLKGWFVPEQIYPWITLLSGIAIAVVGARALARQIQTRLPFAHPHAHEHDGLLPHDHLHEHGAHVHAAGAHGHDDEAHARAHAVAGSAPLRFGPTVWAAMSGGVAPCPAALVVLLAAIAQNVVAYGVIVIVFFSFGLAATLTALGIGVVRGASWLSALPLFNRVQNYGPLLSATIIATIGAVLVGQGFAQQGVQVPAAFISAMAALAIAGYTFSHPFAHRHEARIA